MVSPAKNISFYRGMVLLIQQAFSVLDEQGREEVLLFVGSQQNMNGGFNDRGGQSDLYYSLFAGMVLEAVESKSEVRTQNSEDRKAKNGEPFPEPVEGNPQLATRNLRHFFKHYLSSQSTTEAPGFIELCSLVLLKQNFGVHRFSKLRSVWVIAKAFRKERASINLSYRSFILFLTLDAVLPVRWIFRVAAKKLLGRTVVDSESPCSEVAAKVFLLKILKQNGSKEEELLKSFVIETGGFKAFRHVAKADMLSTAVALFSLHFAESDLRLQKPGCLDFIQQNYTGGAFLSGNGDLTKDLEYTFYGLLALGVLAG